VEDLESEEDLWEMYGRWVAYYEVVREPSRFLTFKAKAHRQHNKQRMRLNIFGDKSFNEATRPCVREDELTMDQLLIIDLVRHAGADDNLPLRVDWREAHDVTFVKKQGHYGDCWTFATATTLEGVHAIKTKSVAISLSAQFLLDCTIYIDGRSGCKGGSILSALKLVKTSSIHKGAGHLRR
jgi:C1A family cysteine protease